MVHIIQDSDNPLAIELSTTGVIDVSDLDKWSILQNLQIETLQESLDNFVNSMLSDDVFSDIKRHKKNSRSSLLTCSR